MSKKDTIRILKNQVCDTCVYKDGMVCAKGFERKLDKIITCPSWWSYAADARIETMQKHLDLIKAAEKHDQARNN